MGLYSDSLVKKKEKLERELMKVNEMLNQFSQPLVDEELKNVNFDGDIIFVDAPRFLYNLDKDMVHVSQYMGNMEIMEDRIKSINVGTYQITDNETILDFFDTLEEQKKVAFYLSPTGSIYHDGRRIRVASF